MSRLFFADYGLIVFLTQVVLISLSGVMAPGAVTAATLAQGGRSRWAGTLIALGHGVVEIPLIFLLMVGLGTILKTDAARILIGVVGGFFLIWLGIQSLREIAAAQATLHSDRTNRPILTGIVLSAANPYFLFWWATVGLNLAMQAKSSGVAAMIIFAAVHWLCDFVWLTILSMTAFHGTAILSLRNQKIILGFCAAAMGVFGGKFLYDAAMLLAK